MKKLIALLFCLVAMPAAAQTEPEQLIRDTADRVMTEIKNNGDSYRQNEAALYEMVDAVVLPHFDFDAMADLALGRYVEKVTAEQRPLIVNEFRTLLVRTYGKALLEYNDEKLIFLPMAGDPASGEVKVRSEIEQAGGFPIPMDYALRKTGGSWKVYDISVDEISLVTNYRSSFARAIKKNGVDGLIDTLRERNQGS